MNTEELIHEGYLAWDEEHASYEFSDEELFAAGAKFILNYLILKGKL